MTSEYERGRADMLEELVNFVNERRTAGRGKDGEACDHPWHRNPALAFPCPECGEGDEPEQHDAGHPHLIDGEFQSDKYPTTPRGKVPLSCKDPTAQDLLWTYAQRRRSVDAEFATDLEIAPCNHGYAPPDLSKSETPAQGDRAEGEEEQARAMDDEWKRAYESAKGNGDARDLAASIAALRFAKAIGAEEGARHAIEAERRIRELETERGQLTEKLAAAETEREAHLNRAVAAEERLKLRAMELRKAESALAEAKRMVRDYDAIKSDNDRGRAALLEFIELDPQRDTDIDYLAWQLGHQFEFLLAEHPEALPAMIDSMKRRKPVKVFTVPKADASEGEGGELPAAAGEETT